jgi:L-histidine Nalpha-methyltransferase
MPTPEFMQLDTLDERALAAEAAAGLRAAPAAVSPKFFYDTLGSRLFEAITELPEYTPTRAEAAILATHGAAIGQAVLRLTGAAPVLVDLGAGNGAKAARLFPLLEPCAYIGVDISVEFMRDSLRRMQREHPQIRMTGVGQDFSTHLTLPPALLSAPTLVFYPGSSIGNFDPNEALRLLRDMRRLAEGGALLIGVDGVRASALLEAAYDDALGVTAAFNLNLLRRLNALLGTDFDVRQWQHRALFESQRSRVEMHLHARQALRVRWPGGEREFAAGESIHTENSYKWQPAAFEALLHDAGFGAVQRWGGEAENGGGFAVFLASARG